MLQAKPGFICGTCGSDAHNRYTIVIQRNPELPEGGYVISFFAWLERSQVIRYPIGNVGRIFYIPAMWSVASLVEVAQ